MLHEGLYFDPVMRDIEAHDRQQPGHRDGRRAGAAVQGAYSGRGLPQPIFAAQRDIGTYGEANSAWTGAEAAAFSKLYGLQSVLAHPSRNTSPHHAWRT